MKTALILTTALALGGCATSPEVVGRLPNERICQMHGSQVKAGFTAESIATVRAELQRRHLVAESEWTDVDQRRVRVGMSQCAMLAVMGTPDRQNRTVSNSTVRVQHVFDSGYRYTKAKYVYTENGVVTAFQD